MKCNITSHNCYVMARSVDSIDMSSEVVLPFPYLVGHGASDLLACVAHCCTGFLLLCPPVPLEVSAQMKKDICTACWTFESAPVLAVLVVVENSNSAKRYATLSANEVG